MKYLPARLVESKDDNDSIKHVEYVMDVCFGNEDAAIVSVFNMYPAFQLTPVVGPMRELKITTQFDVEIETKAYKPRAAIVECIYTDIEKYPHIKILALYTDEDYCKDEFNAIKSKCELVPKAGDDKKYGIWFSKLCMVEATEYVWK